MGYLEKIVGTAKNALATGVLAYSVLTGCNSVPTSSRIEDNVASVYAQEEAAFADARKPVAAKKEDFNNYQDVMKKFFKDDNGTSYDIDMVTDKALEEKMLDLIGGEDKLVIGGKEKKLSLSEKLAAAGAAEDIKKDPQFAKVYQEHRRITEENLAKSNDYQGFASALIDAAARSSGTVTAERKSNVVRVTYGNVDQNNDATLYLVKQDEDNNDSKAELVADGQVPAGVFEEGSWTDLRVNHLANGTRYEPLAEGGAYSAKTGTDFAKGIEVAVIAAGNSLPEEFNVKFSTGLFNDNEATVVEVAGRKYQVARTEGAYVASGMNEEFLAEAAKTLEAHPDFKALSSLGLEAYVRSEAQRTDSDLTADDVLSVRSLLESYVQDPRNKPLSFVFFKHYEGGSTTGLSWLDNFNLKNLESTVTSTDTDEEGNEELVTHTFVQPTYLPVTARVTKKALSAFSDAELAGMLRVIAYQNPNLLTVAESESIDTQRFNDHTDKYWTEVSGDAVAKLIKGNHLTLNGRLVTDAEHFGDKDELANNTRNNWGQIVYDLQPVKVGKPVKKD